MLKMLGSTIIVLGCVLLFGADTASNLLGNADFAKLDAKGIPAQWEARVQKANRFSITPDTAGTVLSIVCKDDQAPSLFMYRPLTLQAGESYRVTFDVKGSPNAKYLVYCEWNETFADGTKKIKGVNTSIRTAPADWTPQSFSFTYRKNCTGPYFVLSVRAGEASFRNIKFVSLD